MNSAALQVPAHVVIRILPLSKLSIGTTNADVGLQFLLPFVFLLIHRH